MLWKRYGVTNFEVELRRGPLDEQSSEQASRLASVSLANSSSAYSRNNQRGSS